MHVVSRKPGLERPAVRLVELVLELHPLQTKRVQVALQRVHAQHHEEGDDGEEDGAYEERNHSADDATVTRQSPEHSLLEEDRRKLLVRQGQRPETKVGRSVTDDPEAELDGLNQLVDENVHHVVLAGLAVVLSDAAVAVNRHGELPAPLRVAAGPLEQGGRRAVTVAANEAGGGLSRVLDVLWAAVDQLVLPTARIAPDGDLALLRTVEQDGLRYQHHGNGYEHDDEQNALHTLLTRVHDLVRLQVLHETHVDDGGDDGRLGEAVVDRRQPLVQNEKGHVAHEGTEERQLRDELEEEVKRLAEVERVEPLEAHAHEHLQEADDDGKLHLERVQHGLLVDGVDPGGVQPEPHREPVLRAHQRLQRNAPAPRRPGGSVGVALPTGTEQIVGKRQEVVVDEPGHAHAVPDVAEHDPKQEGEGDDREGRRVHLLVPRHTIRVHDALEGLRQRPRLVVRRRHRLRVVVAPLALRLVVHQQQRAHAPLRLLRQQVGPDVLLLLLREPTVGPQRDVTSLEVVQYVVNVLFLPAEQRPLLDDAVALRTRALQQAGDFLPKVLFEGAQSILLVADNLLELPQPLVDVAVRLGPVEQPGLEALAQLLQLAERGAAARGLAVNDKDHFFPPLVRGGLLLGDEPALVHDALERRVVLEVGVHVSTHGPENGPGERVLVLRADDPRNVREGHGGVVPALARRGDGHHFRVHHLALNIAL
ncbi:YjiH family protein [Babesia caballi]|uniref:YjiH family protein n=1 Tax=Babesia caballi TaxID=5871 RepID=A0AAV4LNQ4_BABCB|nr:YjiH family protein [Babesia caballi]